MSELFRRFSRGRGNRNLNKEVATRNLFDFADLLEQYDAPHFLAFGTLLGAIRDRDFIGHDVDVDLGTFAEHRSAIQLLCRSKLLASYGFRVLRQGDNIVSVAREEEYIDLYIFTPSDSEYRCCQYKIQSWQLASGFARVNFLGREFNTVKDPEADLCWRYGADWRTPRPGFHAPF